MTLCAYCGRETGTALNYHPDCKERARVAKRDAGHVAVHTLERAGLGRTLRSWLRDGLRGLVALARAPADLPLFERRLLNTDRVLAALSSAALALTGWLATLFAGLVRDGDHGGDTLFLLAFSAGIALLAAWYLVAAVRRSADPGRHPSMRALAPYGAAREVAAQISSEIRPGGGSLVIGRTLLTPTWLIQVGSFALTAIPFRDVVWIYETTSLRTIHYIPIGNRYDVVVHGASGTKIAIGGGSDLGKTGSISAQHAVFSRAPWALRGRAWETVRSMRWGRRARTVADVFAKREQILNSKGRGR